jgi:phage terminase large subunit
VVEKQIVDPDKLISISTATPEYKKLISELSQPTFSRNEAGKILINKQPDGTLSPNHADAVMIAFAPEKKNTGIF